MIKRLFWVAVLIFALSLPVAAAPEEASDPPVKISSVDDLLAMAEAGSGSYILMADLDMAGVAWYCPAFTGSFDGNGHTIMNLTITGPGTDTAISYDGNQKTYETRFAGFFGTLRDAHVKDLHLLNVRACLETTEPCFLGGLAGYSQWSTIAGCTVTGTLELRADTKMFGVGGVVGYGNGTVSNSKADVTLICTDTNKNELDEEFLGGVFATGFMNVLDCDITIDGYCSDYGYVHNGGITGMYLQYPIGGGKEGRLTGNRITGKITFFECNADRRAYCRAEAGEILAFWYTVENNTIDFFRDERWEYDRELRPDMCPEPHYTETLEAPGCDSFGCSIFRCDSCGWEYRDRYTLPAHTVTFWSIVEQPTTELEGLSEAFCDGCGLRFTRTEPRLEPVPTTQPVPEETMPTAPSAQPTEPVVQKADNKPFSPLPILAAMGILTVGLVIFLICKPRAKPGKYERR